MLFVSLDYYIDWPVTSITMRTPQEYLFHSAFGICLCEDRVYDHCCWTIWMHEVWIYLGRIQKWSNHLA